MTQLRHVEGEALRVAEGLVGRGRTAPPDSIAIAEPHAPLIEAVARTFAAGCMRFLLERGATEQRTVLRDVKGRGVRVTGRVWDAGLNEGFSLTFSEDAYTLWWRTARDLLPLIAKKRQRTRSDEIDVTREDRRTLRGAVPVSTHGTGDALLFLLAHEHASYLRLPAALQTTFQQALRDASPLARLWAPDDESAKEAAVRKRVMDAVNEHARVIELVDEALATSWVTRLGALVLHSVDLEELRARAQTFATTLVTFVEAADRARKLHLLRPVALFLARVPTEALPAAFDVRAHALRVPGVRSIADRDEVLAAVGSIVGVARNIDELRTRMATERYGDERYEEAQVVLRIIDDVYGPARAAVQELLRRLSGAVG